MVKELIYCLVLLLLTAVLYRIYHGFLTAEKGTVEFSHTKDYSGNRLLLLNVPWRDQVALGRDPGVFMKHEKAYARTVAGTHLVLPIWVVCWGLAGVRETAVNTNMYAWVNSFGHLTSKEARVMISISGASSKARTSVNYPLWTCSRLCCDHKSSDIGVR